MKQFSIHAPLLLSELELLVLFICTLCWAACVSSPPGTGNMRDGFCKMHFNVAAQSATTAHGAVGKSVTKNDHDAKATIDNNHGMVDPIDVRSTTTKSFLDLVERTAVKGAVLPENQEPTYAVGTAVSIQYCTMKKRARNVLSLGM